MKCFSCKDSFENWNLFVNHCKVKHNLKSYSTYRCNESLCTQAFSTLGSFKKHVIKKHKVRLDNFKVKLQNKVDKSKYYSTNSSGCNSSLIQIENESSSLPSNDKIFNFECEINQVYDCGIKFVLGLHNNNNFSRKDIINIQTKIKQYVINPILDIVKQFCIFSSLESSVMNDLYNILNKCQNPFLNCNTEYILNEWLKKNDYISDIHQINMNNVHLGNLFRNAELTIEENCTKGSILPVRFQIKKFFEKENTLNDMLKYIAFLDQDKTNISNFVQGQLWLEKIKLYPNKILIPYFLYVDDFEINNPLGSHSTVHSITNVYYNFPCFKEVSKLKQIFLAAVFPSKDLKLNGNEISSAALVQELKYLEEVGISIKTDGITRTVHFILGLVHGDNLGVNTFLNFSKSFSSLYFCRLCRASKNETHKLCVENQNQMRTIKNYNLDLNTNNPSETGISSYCILNTIPSFHVTNNAYVDIMHDIFEGICHYNLCHIIQYFIDKMKFFSLETLNNRKKNFDFGTIEIGNISPEIKINHLKNRHLKMSAREMMSFMHYIPLIIGDFIPVDDEVWAFLVNFIEIIDILLCLRINQATIDLLKHKIETHNNDYVRLFNDKLKPKHHFLTHYPNVILQSGPLRLLWCFRFEAKHKEFKIYSHAITSRKNICLTLAKKFQFKFAHILFEDKTESHFYEIHEKNKIKGNYEKIISEKLGVPSEYLTYYKTVIYKSTEYKPGFYVAKYLNDIHIYVILEVFHDKSSNMLKLFCQELRSIQYVPHYVSYEVNRNLFGLFQIILIEELLGPPVNISKTARGVTMIRIKQFFQSILE